MVYQLIFQLKTNLDFFKMACSEYDKSRLQEMAPTTNILTEYSFIYIYITNHNNTFHRLGGTINSKLLSQ